ncbi:energy transducer TonB [Prosthecobacter sp. SYSU 5D2]|uniref:energy transducer TonB n=1 Tax=Prosthecobacter sp. SYSU 5D2 TaxID=3134134 RepID=UPI0031FF29D8
MSTPAHPASKTDKRKGTGKWVLVQLLFMVGYGAGLTIFVLGVIPYLQIVTGGGAKDLLVRTVAAVEAPPPPDSMLDEPPPPPDTQEEPPPDMTPPPDLGSTSLDIGMVGGTGAAIPMNFGGAAMQNAMANFSMGEAGTKPRAVYQVQPKIPANLRTASGRVEVEFTVDVQGRVQNPRVTSSFSPLMNEPVITAIKQWRFEPGQRGGKRVPTKTKQPFKFGK